MKMKKILLSVLLIAFYESSYSTNLAQVQIMQSIDFSKLIQDSGFETACSAIKEADTCKDTSFPQKLLIAAMLTEKVLNFETESISKTFDDEMKEILYTNGMYCVSKLCKVYDSKKAQINLEEHIELKSTLKRLNIID